MSCRKETSPTTSVAGLFRPKANPAALLITPSMPLAPRFAATGAPTPHATCTHMHAHAAHIRRSTIAHAPLPIGVKGLTEAAVKLQQDEGVNMSADTDLR